MKGQSKPCWTPFPISTIIRFEDGCRTMDVGSWLRSLGLDQYEAQFRDNKIDADVLPRPDRGRPQGHRRLCGRRSAQALLDAIAGLAGPKPAANAPASPPKPAPAGAYQISAERRPITVMFCDLVGSTSLAAKLDAEDWRNLVNAYLDEASKAVTGSWRSCAEEARRRADGALRLPAGAGERRRARRAGGACHPARARRPQRQKRPIGRARAFRAHRPRDRSRSSSTPPARCSAKRRTLRRASKLLLSQGRSWSREACSARWPDSSSSRRRARTS